MLSKVVQPASRRLSLLVLLSIAFSCVPEKLQADSHFFQGKIITIIHGREAGGAGDLVVKALVPYLEKHIPGSPKIVNEYMPGGGSRKAANYIFTNARPAGLTLGNLSGGMVSLAILGESGILYDLDKFTYLGSPYSTYHTVLVSGKQAGLIPSTASCSCTLATCTPIHSRRGKNSLGSHPFSPSYQECGSVRLHPGIFS